MSDLFDLLAVAGFCIRRACYSGNYSRIIGSLDQTVRLLLFESVQLTHCNRMQCASVDACRRCFAVRCVPNHESFCSHLRNVFEWESWYEHTNDQYHVIHICWNERKRKKVRQIEPLMFLLLLDERCSLNIVLISIKFVLFMRAVDPRSQ